MSNNKKLINNKNVVSLLIVLGLILVITCSIVCYIIGKNSGLSGSGKIIDTIIIEEPQNTDKLPVYLTGKVLYSDGTPYQGTVRLFSKMQETKTDKNGLFLFQGIVYGKHSLVILDDKGNTISEMNLTINQSTKDNKIVINKNEFGYEVSVGINIALIEVNIEFNKNTKDIILNEEDITIVNYNGEVITQNKIDKIDKSIIETYNGNKVMPEGVIVIPNEGVILANGTFIASTGEINYSEDETSLPSGYKVINDGSVELPDKTIIKPDGTIIRPEESINPIGDESEVNPKENIKADPNDNLEDDPEDDPKADPEDDPEDPDPLTWDAPIVKQGNIRWDQLTTLDLFATNDSTIDGKIYPGVSGEYEFSIENINPYNVAFSIDMDEQEHEAGNINLSYRLKYYDEELEKYVYVIGDNNNYLKPSELLTTDKVILLSNRSVTYTLEWIWGNENNKQQDLKDGKVGISSNRVHYIDMKIYIENA